MKLEFNKEEEIKRFWIEGAGYKDTDEAIEASIERAVRDFTARTEKKKKGAENKSLAEHLKHSDDNGKNLIGILEEYFKAPPANQDVFNDWHNKTCIWILDRINEIYDNSSYGKAQKILNMTFKNLYCTAFGQNKDDRFFRYCHMALDSFTLEWIFRNIYKSYNIKGKNSRLCKGKTPAWSKFTYDDTENKPYSYSGMVKLITDYFKECEPDITPFQAEFVIWRKIQMEMAAESFYAEACKYFEITPTQKASEFKKESLEKKIKAVKELMVKNP